MKTPSSAPPNAAATRPFVFGEGRISGYVASALGGCALLGVLCFKYPEWLTTAELRASLYNFEFAATLLWVAVAAAFLLGTVSYVLNTQKRLAVFAVGSAMTAVLLGAFTIERRTVDAAPFSFGLDWFLLAFVFSMLVFIPLEKAFARQPQQVLRPAWRADLGYFFVSHLMIQFFLLFTNAVHEHLFAWAQSDAVSAFVRGFPVWAQFLGCVIVADLFQATSHRAYHRFPRLWKFHAVHHSSEQMDWLAGSRTHLVEALATRCAVIVPLYVIGFNEAALNGYVVLVGVQAVLVHANVSWRFGWLEYVIATPRFHHWHHSTDPAYADSNYAVHLPLIDMMFGTFKLPPRDWPSSYGVFGERVPDGFFRQLLYPFRRKSGPRAVSSS